MRKKFQTKRKEKKISGKFFEINPKNFFTITKSAKKLKNFSTSKIL